MPKPFPGDDEEGFPWDFIDEYDLEDGAESTSDPDDDD